MAKKISRLIGIIIIVFILSKLNFAEIKTIFWEVDKHYLFIGLALTIIIIFIKSLRWNYLMQKQEIKYSLIDSFFMYSASTLLGTVTPGRIGDLSKIFYLKTDGHSYGKSATSVILDRLFDILFLLIAGTIGMLFFLNVFKNAIPYVSIFTVGLLILFYLVIKNELTKKILSKILNFLIPEKYQKSWQLNLHDFIGEFKKLKLKHYFFVLFLTIFSWFAYYVQMLIFAKSLGINIPFLYLAISGTVAGLVAMIPISYFGIGTRDLVLIALFSLISISKESAVAISSLVLSTHAVMAVWGLICWFKKPIRLG